MNILDYLSNICYTECAMMVFKKWIDFKKANVFYTKHGLSFKFQNHQKNMCSTFQFQAFFFNCI